MEAGLFATAIYRADAENFPNGGARLRGSRSTRRPAGPRWSNTSVVDDVGTVMNPLLLKGQIIGGVAMGVGQNPERGHPLRQRRPAHHRASFMD